VTGTELRSDAGLHIDLRPDDQDGEVRRAEGTAPDCRSATGAAQAYGELVATKSTPSSQPKKPGKTLKEKRAAKHAKRDAQKQVRRTWEVK
jgi:hypothetical protein